MSQLRHVLSPSQDIDETLSWLRARGYRALITPGSLGTGAGLIAQRDMDPPFVATLGDTLLYDDTSGQVTVQ